MKWLTDGENWIWLSDGESENGYLMVKSENGYLMVKFEMAVNPSKIGPLSETFVNIQQL